MITQRSNQIEPLALRRSRQIEIHDRPNILVLQILAQSAIKAFREIGIETDRIQCFQKMCPVILVVFNKQDSSFVPHGPFHSASPYVDRDNQFLSLVPKSNDQVISVG